MIPDRKRNQRIINRIRYEQNKHTHLAIKDSGLLMPRKLPLTSHPCTTYICTNCMVHEPGSTSSTKWSTFQVTGWVLLILKKNKSKTYLVKGFIIELCLIQKFRSWVCMFLGMYPGWYIYISKLLYKSILYKTKFRF